MRSYIGSAVLAMHEDPKLRDEMRRRIKQEVRRRSESLDDDDGDGQVNSSR